MGTPSRILVFVPSMLLEAARAVRLIPFSACKLPVGTTKLDVVTSGRSVWISLWLSGQYSAAEAAAICRPSAARSSASTNPDRTAFMIASLRHFAPLDQLGEDASESRHALAQLVEIALWNN
jgi:hypothetical protein